MAEGLHNGTQSQLYHTLLRRYEDNFFPVNNLMVITLPTDKSSITDFGPPDKFTMENLSYLLGKQSFSGAHKFFSQGLVGQQPLSWSSTGTALQALVCTSRQFFLILDKCTGT